MYVAHLAIGVALKARFPQVPAAPIMIGVGLMDILNGIFIMLGIDRISANPEALPFLFFDLDFVDWDHSLLMSLVIAAIWGGFFFRNRTVALVAGASVFLHWLSDWPVHNYDLALYPHSDIHFGWGLWEKWGVYAWLLEGVLTAALAWYAWRRYAAVGERIVWPCALLLLLFIQCSPWLSPMRYVVTLDEPLAHLLAGALITLSFVIPCLLLTWMFNRVDSARRV